MAARNRPRAGQVKDEVDEERSIWSQIRSDAKRGDQLLKSSNELTKQIVDLTEKQNTAIARGESPSAAVDTELEECLRANIKLTEELQNLIESDNGNDILKSLEILAALRDAHEPDPTSRAGSAGKSQRDRNTKRKHTETLEDRESIESPGVSSPKVMIPTSASRLVKSAASRANSVPVAREGSVKADDGGESADSLKLASEKHKLQVTTEVLYRNKAKAAEGEGILCRVTSVIGEGKQRRYEIIDSDPDPPTPSLPYRASVNHLVAIPPPSANTTLPDLPAKRHVLALYPGTTTFYKAEVVATWTLKNRKEEKKGDGDYFVRLRFEGEDEADRECSVERRYVLPDR
ncbi:uncharacterized protein BDZ99DRAFT_432044 [Mytilinidion resinicola]|uniref:SGF29 C-terminal domain-containing protein n=1 Tax=Mytilinidion resinicola TaxID=574789 RepID=A0A6A6Z9L1_9PEZI|nr:uncharacterized protein BDZ99DRAFT_432044 [Mytilinidion resinicola]KAF2817720.1 hypothetical protein BDZ99DRAFT_432044 [Mytilinidion resinicola]